MDINLNTRKNKVTPMTYTGAVKSRELRQHHRFRVDSGTLLVSWLDLSGSMKSARTRALNISACGIAFELPEAALPLLVRFQSDRLRVRGAGAVRHCRKVGPKYVVGLEFTDNLRWRAPEGEAQEPITLSGPDLLRQASK